MSNPSVAIEEKIRKTVSSSERIADELRRGRPTSRGSTCSHIRATNSKTDGQAGLGRLDGVDPRDSAGQADVPVDSRDDGSQRCAAPTLPCTTRRMQINQLMRDR
jgi:hypothetical protein